jgi:hypothetical protein
MSVHDGPEYAHVKTCKKYNRLGVAIRYIATELSIFNHE